MATLIAQPAAHGVQGSRQRLRRALEHAAHLLPAQGPIGVFIHHNTLHALQHLPFEEAVRTASEIYGAEPFMTEDAYREQLALGRITPVDIEAAVRQDADVRIIPDELDRRTLRTAILCAGLRTFDAATVRWHMEETDFLQRFRGDLSTATRLRLLQTGSGDEERDVRALFSECLELPASLHHPETTVKRPSGMDADAYIHPLLIRLCAAYLDQGMAYWPMPNRNEGFLKAVRSLLIQPWGLLPAHFAQLDAEFRRQAEANLDAEEVVLDMMYRLGTGAEDYQAAVQAELLELPGWAGMMHRLEQEPELAPHVRVQSSLMDFLAVRLTLKAVAAANLMDAADEAVRQGLELESSGAEIVAEAARRFDALQILGIGVAGLRALCEAERGVLIAEIDALDSFERRRLLHLAYEHNHEAGILRPLANHRRMNGIPAGHERAAAQVFFCIDEREESMRRHLEELAPDIETHAAAGFFGVAVDYTGIDDAHGVALCPVVVKPQHAVREHAVEQHAEVARTRQRVRRMGARLGRHLAIGSRSLVRGWAGTSLLGGLSVFPLVMRVLAPRQYGKLRDLLHRKAVPQPQTALDFVRKAENDRTGALLRGFSTAEKVDRVAGMLGPAGLRDCFARLVVILGHGSTSLNNPHESAHDCGACGGRRGGPNARLFAAMANHPEVREGLAARGIRIPGDTWFVGGYHDTCNDAVDLYDLEVVPAEHRRELQILRSTLNRARALDAEERARRFEAADPKGGPKAALRHVQERAEHLCEPRPEYGHATNAVCVVGRRALTKGLFMDRRSFLVSYDATVDPDDEGLTRLLGAAVPVCAGINLEYYFSFTDNERYGCGTKLPHNITGLIGVMNGPESDLRTGLPLQMVEIHEPVRILFVVETTPERVARVFAANPGLTQLLENHWIRLATIDPETGVVHVRRDRHFQKLEIPLQDLPSARVSSEWFRGKLRHLSLARITGVQGPSTT